MILDAQNLHIYLLPKPSNSRSASLEALVLTPFSVLLTCQTREVSFQPSFLAMFLFCVRVSFFFKQLTVAGNWTCCWTQ